ncbi:hypothetical protein [Sorangium sp. So ce341]|uniref:hypothetical protein n=1 Tax=Sorangium sp. So ce341 TaxID=3133302 RepID=UPI003F618916
MAARSYERLGRLLEARALYQRVMNEPLEASAPRAFQQAQADAKSELADLTPRIPTLEVAVRGAARAAVKLTDDGQRIAPETPVPLDPGEHTVVVTVPGRPVVTRTIHLKEKAKEYIVIGLSPPPTAAPPARRAPVASGGDLRKVMFIGGGVTAGAGVIAGTVFTLLALGKAGDADDLRYDVDFDPELRGQCPKTNKPPLCAKLSDTVSLQYTFSDVAIGSFIIGTAGVGTLIYALADRPAVPARRMEVLPLVGLGTAGVSFNGRF